ncbi:MAG: TetR/AcrR family transcriptional regulator C-terminal ligand-binding domain-containing protein [Dermatophilaceae bacterium]
MSREDPRIQRTRRKALAAALDLLRTEGPAAVTHQRVAEAAQVARATMYLHWPDRGSLLFGAVTQLPVGEAPRSGDLREDLVVALGVMRRLLEQPPVVAALLELLARAEVQPEASEARRVLGENADTHLRSLLRSGVESGELAATDVDAGIDILLGPLLFRRLVRGVGIDDDFTRRVVDDFFVQHGPHPR